MTKKPFRTTTRVLTLAAMSVPVVTGTAHAYIDPGTGGFLLQLILGGIAGAAVILKLYWHKLKGLFIRSED